MKHFCVIVLVLLGVAFVTYIPLLQDRDLEKGRLTIHVERIIAETKRSPDLFVEIETKNITWRSQIHYSSKSIDLNESFIFEHMPWMGLVLFRIKDATTSPPLLLGFTALSPSSLKLDRYMMYKMDSNSWIVMRFEWETEITRPLKPFFQ